MKLKQKHDLLKFANRVYQGKGLDWRRVKRLINVINNTSRRMIKIKGTPRHSLPRKPASLNSVSMAHFRKQYWQNGPVTYKSDYRGFR